MLAPKRILHRKVQRGSMKGQAKGNTELHFGEFGIQALEAHWITNRQIEAARIAMTRYMKRGGRVYITIFPDKPITKKPAETRMGSGKGNPEEWVAVVKPGRIMFEVKGVPEEVAREALRLAQHKLPIKTKIVAAKNAEQRIEKEMAEEAALEAKWAAEDAAAQGGELMKPAEIRELSDAQLVEKLKEMRAELFNLRFQMATSQLDNTARVNTVKKDIARVLTEQRAREIAAEKSAVAE